MVQHPHMTHLHPLLSYSPEAFSPQRASPGFSPDTGKLPLSPVRPNTKAFVSDTHLCCHLYSRYVENARRLLPGVSRRRGSDSTSSRMAVSKTLTLFFGCCAFFCPHTFTCNSLSTSLQMLYLSETEALCALIILVMIFGL